MAASEVSVRAALSYLGGGWMGSTFLLERQSYRNWSRIVTELSKGDRQTRSGWFDIRPTDQANPRDTQISLFESKCRQILKITSLAICAASVAVERRFVRLPKQTST
jgi:hypothetical protein